MSESDDRFTHLFISIASVSRLQKFTMRSLFIKALLHPVILPITTHSVWCSSPEVRMDTGFEIDLSKLGDVTLKDLNVVLELHSRQQQTNALIGVVELPLTQRKLVDLNGRDAVFFYRKSRLNLLKPGSTTAVARITVTVAAGYEDQRAFIDPPIKFTQITTKENAVVRRRMSVDEDKVKKEDTWKKSAMANGFMPEAEVRANWELFARQHGWRPPGREACLSVSPPLTEVNIDPCYVGPSAPPPEATSSGQGMRIQSNVVVSFDPNSLGKSCPLISRSVSVFDLFRDHAFRSFYEKDDESDVELDNHLSHTFKYRRKMRLPRLPKVAKTPQSVSTWRQATNPMMSPPPPQRKTREEITLTPSLERILSGSEFIEGMELHLSDVESDD